MRGGTGLARFRHRLTDQRARIGATSGQPGPEGSIGKLVMAELNQDVYEFCMELLGPEATLYGDYTMRSGSRIGPVRAIGG